MAYKAHKLLEGYEKTNSDNLPEVNIIALAHFIAMDSNFISPEISNIKAMRNDRESYALGGCKHQLALLGWMHRRFEDKTPTEKACYWKKFKLSNVGKTIKFILVKDLGIAHCNTVDGSLVDILHVAKLRETSAMARGTRLESQVLQIVSKKQKMTFERYGLITRPEHPIFGASPDGINENFTVEIKCPTNYKSYFNFIHSSDSCLPSLTLGGRTTSHPFSNTTLWTFLKPLSSIMAMPRFNKSKKPQWETIISSVALPPYPAEQYMNKPLGVITT
ncbi:hypothetical protein OUZ56_029979 [Daphnia magna]|uniref:YqaJ viral recombinase domain-containing protein n=1 Tax=Daphnia magna TaxID=35525 RepID=A0ABR0B8G3_9CRUS|nr:hypothetical protein OUZ56_029979 [Daphnia magna]